MDACTKGILQIHQIDSSEFDADVMSCLPDASFVIPEEELLKRRDFRKDCIFTIDPLSARYAQG